jgi:hypothetical protein
MGSQLDRDFWSRIELRRRRINYIALREGLLQYRIIPIDFGVSNYFYP